MVWTPSFASDGDDDDDDGGSGWRELGACKEALGLSAADVYGDELTDGVSAAELVSEADADDLRVMCDEVGIDVEAKGIGDSGGRCTVPVSCPGSPAREGGGRGFAACPRG